MLDPAPSFLADPGLVALLLRHEGLKLSPYRDSVGKLTIGVGRNLDDVGISRSEAMFLLGNDVGRASAGMDNALPWWRDLDPVRQRVLIDMAFNLGLTRLLGFTQTLQAIRAGEFATAADKMLQSKWASQVGGRAAELSRMLRTGVSLPDD